MALWADLFDRGIDLWAVLDGEGPHSAAEAWAVAQALPDHTRTAAAVLGDVEATGWGTDRELALATYNVLLDLLRFVPMWKKPPEIPHVPSPASKAREQREREERLKQLSTPEGVMAYFGA